MVLLAVFKNFWFKNNKFTAFGRFVCFQCSGTSNTGKPLPLSQINLRHLGGLFDCNVQAPVSHCGCLKEIYGIWVVCLIVMYRHQ